MDREDILKKLDRGQTLSLEEERYYLTEILSMSPTAAEQLIFRTENKGDSILID